MRLQKFFLVGLVIIILSGCGLAKKKRFLDYFKPYNYDTLTVTSTDHSDLYLDANSPHSIRGMVIDSAFWGALNFEGTEDLLNFVSLGSENGPVAYYKIKLLMGNYFLIIRSGGEYWNSRYYGCLYNEGGNIVYRTILLAECFGDAGEEYFRYSTLKKQEKEWTIFSHDYYHSPVDWDKYQMDSLFISEGDIETAIVVNTEEDVEHDQFRFLVKNKSEKSYIK